MAYRRRGGMTRASTFQEDIFRRPQDNADDVNVKNINKKLSSSHIFTASSSSSSSSSAASLAAQAIRASAAYRDSSLSSSYAADSVPHRSMVFDVYEDTSARNDSKGFWGVLARKAKAILDDDSLSQQLQAPAKSSFHMSDISTTGQHSYPVSESVEKTDHPPLRKGLDKITSSLNHIGDTFEKAFEEGRHLVENKTADIIQGTRKLQIRQKGNSPEAQVHQFGATSAWQQPNVQSAEHQNQQMNRETQLKASRDVAMATAAKAKLLLRELKTLKADMAFEKQRGSQLEEENKILRESHQKGDYPADDDLIRLQLETLLAEKARLAHENSIYARENRFLREIVEYHQLTMQDVVYLDEGSEEVTEIYPTIKMLSISPPSSMSPTSPSEISTSASSLVTKEVFPMQLVPNSDAPQNTGAVNLKEEDTESILVNLEKDKNTLQVLGENTK